MSKSTTLSPLVQSCCPPTTLWKLPQHRTFRGHVRPAMTKAQDFHFPTAHSSEVLLVPEWNADITQSSFCHRHCLVHSRNFPHVPTHVAWWLSLQRLIARQPGRAVRVAEPGGLPKLLQPTATLRHAAAHHTLTPVTQGDTSQVGAFPTLWRLPLNSKRIKQQT